MTDLLHTPLHAWHAAHRGRLVPFAGWSMPVQYTSILDEHRATRTHAAMFDVSHMGRLRFDGEPAAAYLDSLLTRRTLGLPLGAIRYSLVTNQQGGVLDDVLVYHLEDDGGPYHLLVVNASNREKILRWLDDHPPPAGVRRSDLTTATAMIAVQGPRAVAIAESLLDCGLPAMRYFSGRTIAGKSVAGAEHPLLISRTGYTGEDGCELIVPAAAAPPIWEALHGQGVVPAGLGARDTLRLEAAMPLYGHELTEDHDPFEAGLGFAVQLKDREFVGSAALRERKSRPPQRVRAGLTLSGRRIARQGHAIRCDGQPVGSVTSGSLSPTLDQPIAMAYLTPESAAAGQSLEVDIRGKAAEATVVPLPFYHRET